MQADSAELITLYYGQAVGPDARGQAERLVGQRYPSATVELLEGGQPFYDFIVTVE
jgi:dihydroxyacetone kinase-like predicted kinase